MSQPNATTFRTKSGTCTITPEQIVLRREGPRGAASQRLYGNSTVRILVIYGLLGACLLAYAVWSWRDGHKIAAILPGAFGLLLLWVVFLSRQNSAAATIDRLTIRSVEAHPPRPPITRGYFRVWFADDRGQQRQRLIMLPGSLSDGDAEYGKAVAAMRVAGLLPPAEQPGLPDAAAR